MPAQTLASLPHYVCADPTNADCEWFTLFHFILLTGFSHPVDYADLPIIDVSLSTTPEARAELAIQVRDAMTDHGFFYVINHGYTSSQVLIII